MRYIILIAFVLIGCKSTDVAMMPYCEQTEDRSKEQAKFIIDCAKAANPLSDEEGEDLVQQCEFTSNNVFKKHCSQKLQYQEYKFDGIGVGWIPCEQAPYNSASFHMCKDAGYKR